MDQRQALKLVLVTGTVGLLESCTPFYSRHYTKGLFYEISVPHAPLQVLKKSKATEPEPGFREPRTIATHSVVPVAKPLFPNQCREKPLSTSVREQRTPHQRTPAIRDKKRLPGCDSPRYVSTKTQRSAFAGEVALYFLALLMALGIIGLAIYFLPAILIPSAASSAFTSAIIFAAALTVVLLALVVYALLKKINQLFRTRHRDTDEV